jgi:uncharacterized protein
MSSSKINPFKIKGLARGGVFFHRRLEIEKLLRHALGGQHTFLLAPRRMGKSSLLDQVQGIIQLEKKALVTKIDLFMCTNLDDFLSLLSRELIKAQKNPLTKLIASIRKSIPRLAPSLSISTSGEVELNINTQTPSQKLTTLGEILSWYDSHSKKYRKVLILDEIQEILNFENAEQVEKALRSTVQSLDQTTVLYAGSSPTLLHEMFSKKSRPFYQSAIPMLLGFADKNDAQVHLEKKLAGGTLLCPSSLISEMVELTQGHPYYVQLFGYYAWESHLEFQSWKKVNISLLADMVLQQERSGFEGEIAQLSNQQRQVFRAICKEPYQQITSKAFLEQHRLPAHSSVLKAVKKLELLGFILKGDKGYFPSDPILAYWWKKL